MLNFQSIILATLLFNMVEGFIPQFQSKKQQVFEPFYDNEDQKTVIFHTAVFNKITTFVYSELISKLNDDNLKVIVPGDKCKVKKLEENLTVVGHSSGAIKALENCKNKKVNKLVLIDPVDNRALDDDDDYEPLELENIEKALLIYTKKSYDWNLFPVSFPFVPDKFSLKPKMLNIKDNENRGVIEVSNFGHCDVLDKKWADLVHNTIAKGSDNRDEIPKYHKWLSFAISSIAFDRDDDLSKKNKLSFKNYKFKKNFNKKSPDDLIDYEEL